MPSSDPDPVTRTGVAFLAAVQTSIGGWMVVAPGSFWTQVAPFGARDDHLVRDMASWELALALVAALAVRRPAWRIPVLALALAHYGLHAANHVLDVGRADPGWVGPFDLVVIALGAAGLAWLLGHTRRIAA